MPVPKKRTISQPDPLKGEAPEHKMPEEQEFRHYLRSLAVSAVRVLIEKVMCEELDQCGGAGWGECTPDRKGYRNGYYQRDLVTSTGRIEDLCVPRDREGQFHTQVFERYSRYEPEVKELDLIVTDGHDGLLAAISSLFPATTMVRARHRPALGQLHISVCLFTAHLYTQFGMVSRSAYVESPAALPVNVWLGSDHIEEKPVEVQE